jgi:DNA-binding IclR family transcriptional regulator
LAPTFSELTSTAFGKAFAFAMPPKKATALGAALQPLDTNQKRKATSPTPQEEELDQEIRDLEAIDQQV